MSQLLEFIGNHVILVTSFVVVLIAYLYSLYSDKNASYTRITPDQLTRLVNRENAKIVDVRSPEAYASGHIVNAINIPLADIEAGKAKLSGLGKKPVVAYCDRGISSQRACKKLSDEGVSQVFNLSGGVQAWVADKMPLSK